MEIAILVGSMTVVGALMGWVAGLIWKENRPIGIRGDYIAAITSAILTGLLDWYVIPAMGFSETLKYIGVALEPPAMALIVLWIIRKAKE